MASKQAILTVDVGNTSVSSALYLPGKSKTVRFTRIDHAVTRKEEIVSILDAQCEGYQLDGSVLCSVVPTKNRAWAHAMKVHVGRKPHMVTCRSRLGIGISYPKPESIGADRLANACAGAALFGTPVVIADFGTALTFDIVIPEKGYTGGIIAPGLPLMFSYLADKTALLPSIEPAPVRRIVGRSTREAMQIGARYGYRGMAREIIEALEEELAEPFTLCATGGYAPWVMKGLELPVKLVKDLTLIGCGKIYELNQDASDI